MKISKKAYYGLRAILVLAQSPKPLSIHTLATLERLPEDYLEKILQSLRRAGLVMARKGTAGGYALAKPSRGISVWDIVRTLDGPMKIFDSPKNTHSASNASGVAHAGWPCPEVSHCQSNEVWRTLETNIEKTLSRITLSQLIPKA